MGTTGNWLHMGKERAAQVDLALIFEVRVDEEIEELSRLRRTRVKGY